MSDITSEPVHTDWVQRFLKRIAIPRPNHSQGLKKVAGIIKQQLQDWALPFNVNSFRLQPHLNLFVGGTVLGLACAFCYLLFAEIYVAALLVALLVAFLIFAPIIWIPVIRLMPFSVLGENIVVSLKPDAPSRELIICAHYDTKTNFFSLPVQRFLHFLLIPVSALGCLLPIIQIVLKSMVGVESDGIFMIKILLAGSYLMFWLIKFLDSGGYLFIPKRHQSPGVIDNAAAVTALMAVLKVMDRGTLARRQTSLSFLFTAGEEAGRQGAAAYLRETFKRADFSSSQRHWLVNLELVAQPGDIMVWKQYGDYLRFLDCDAGLLRRFEQIVYRRTGRELVIRGKTADDALSFLKVGIPALTLSNTGRPLLDQSVFHSKFDRLERFSRENFDSLTEILLEFIDEFTAENW